MGSAKRRRDEKDLSEGKDLISMVNSSLPLLPIDNFVAEVMFEDGSISHVGSEKGSRNCSPLGRDCFEGIPQEISR